MLNYFCDESTENKYTQILFCHLNVSRTPTGRRGVFAGRIAGEALARKVHIARRGQTVAPFR